jgi:hypothetical protein
VVFFIVFLPFRRVVFWLYCLLYSVLLLRTSRKGLLMFWS